MLTNDSLPSAGRPETTTRRRLLHMGAALSAAVPVAALTAGGAASLVTPAAASRRIRRAILVPRFGGDATADWYPAALSQLADLGIRTTMVSLPEPTAPGIDETVAAIANAVGDNPQEIAQTILIGHSVGSRALLAYLSRRGGHRPFAGVVSVAGWFMVDDLISYPALARWVNMDLHFASIASSAGPITVLLSDDDPFTADWRATAADWLGKLGASVHIAHGADATVVEPGYFRTDFLSARSLSSTAVKIDDYADTVGKMRTFAAAANHQQPGDPQRLAQVIVQLAAARKPPTRLALGSDTVARIEEKHRDVERELDLWRSVSVSTDFVRA
jgi:predicted alpha/beta hydrolase family esterase